MQAKGEPCGECADGCGHFEVFERYDNAYIERVGHLLEGIERIEFDPALASLYDLADKDLMIAIKRHMKQKEAGASQQQQQEQQEPKADGGSRP